MQHRQKLGVPNLWLLRHGQSAGNVAREAAETSGALEIQIPGRDMDVPLSQLGEQQARSIGAWFRAAPVRPTVVLSSPFVRARHTADLVLAEIADRAIEVVVDERLRERELGSLDRLTRAGITAKYPHEVELRAQLGKFYYRPPGGESWCDVVLRLRTVFDHLRLAYAGERVMIVAHEVIVMCARYILEQLAERAVLEINASGDVANCGLTSYVAEPGGALELVAFNFVAPLDAAGTPVTTAPDPARRA